MLRAARKDGQGEALPCPGAMRRGNHPAPAGAPLHRGDGVWTLVARVISTQPNVQSPVLIPSVEGCRPQAAGWFPPQGATPCAPPPKPPSLEGGAASAAGGAAPPS
ncbi:MAG: hypothetical protein LBM98_00095 [Oscillospiraceae bacterium]|nr:hypothetical protein [Oscillospiraceae bacterium]